MAHYLIAQIDIKNREKYAEYEAGFMPGDILFADPFVLHATQKNALGLRLSLEFTGNKPATNCCLLRVS